MGQHIYVKSQLDQICYWYIEIFFPAILLKFFMVLLTQSKLNCYSTSKWRFSYLTITFELQTSCVQEFSCLQAKEQNWINYLSQKCIVRLIYRLRRCDSCRPIFVQFGILFFPCIYIFNCLNYIHLNISKYKRCSDFHGYETRHTDTIAFPKHRTAKYESSPSFMGIPLYSRLPSMLKSMNGRSFKREVKLLLIKGCYYSVDEFLKDSIH